jgi:hypothetical protein
MTGIQRLLPIFVAAKGYYLLPAVAGTLVAIRFFMSRSDGPRPQRALLVALAATAAFSVPIYFNFFNYHFGGFLNAHEFFHYYLGSKFAPEVGYFGMYDAALVADDETHLAFRPANGYIKDLRTYGPRAVTDVLAARDAIKARFTPERWREWVKDVFYFKTRLRGSQWSEVLSDLGYNATPVWTMLVASSLSGRIATDDAAGMTFLALLDVILLTAAALCVGWAFGAWPALLMIVFLASSYLMAHVHMKGAFLRTDFVVALVGAMCAIRKGRHGLAGALCGYSTLVRVFPAIFLLGPVVKLASDLVPVGREAMRRTGGTARRLAFLAGHAAAAALLLALAWAGIGAGLRSAVTSSLCGPALLFALAIVPATVGLAALSLTAWGTSRTLLDRRHARFFGAFAAVVALLVGGSIAYSGGTGAWVEFARKMALHRAAYNHWNIGITSVVIAQFDPPGPRAQALAARPELVRSLPGNVWFVEETVRDRAWLIRILQVAALVASWIAARRFDDTLAFAFGFVMTYFIAAPTYYYYIVLLVPFLFFAAHPDRLRGTLGLLYLFLSGALGFTFYFLWDQFFITYFWNSVLVLGLTIAMIGSAFGRFTPWPDATAPARRAR